MNEIEVIIFESEEQRAAYEALRRLIQMDIHAGETATQS